MKQRLSILFASVLVLWGIAESQSREEQRVLRAAKGKEVVSQDELVSFNSDVPYAEAIEALSAMSKKFLKKPLIDTSPLGTRIGVNVQSMYWRDALELILRTNGLWFIEHPDYIQVVPAGQVGIAPTAPGVPGVAPVRGDTAQALAKAREVVISAIFVEIDQSKLRESGISFSVFRGRDLNLGVEFQGAGGVTSDIFGVTVDPRSRRLAVDITTALRMFESEAIGEIIARPQLTVRTGSFGRVQSGSDFSIKERDFAGNVIDRFYSTGTILEVTPRVYTYGTTEMIDLQYKVERSNAQPGAVSTIVNKTETQGKLLLLDGEENYVAGLYINEEQKVREGIPFLKDLPWWFFGLRYIFGYDLTKTTRKELIVLLKAELVPLVDERINVLGKSRDVIQDKLREAREDTERRRSKNP